MLQPVRFRRIKVSVTQAGWLYIAVTLLIGAAAVNTTNNLLYLVTAGLLALMAISGFVAFRALRQLEVEMLLPREWFAGQETPVRVGLLNHRRRLPSFLMRIARAEQDVVLVEVPAGGRADGILPIMFTGRGRQPLGDLQITSPFPFALFRRGGVVRLEGDVLVYPEPLAPAHELPDAAQGAEVGTGAGRRGVGGDYWGARPYAPGDALGRVDWKAWARLGVLTVKEFEEESAPPLRLTLDSVPGPGLEERLSQLTSLILEAERLGRPVGLTLPGETIEPGHGLVHRERTLRALALFPSTGEWSAPRAGAA
jgi:uncharacterized protein (DUF58 family)